MSKYNLHFVEPVPAGLFLLRAGLIQQWRVDFPTPSCSAFQARTGLLKRCR
jgi:hypothetical protein